MTWCSHNRKEEEECVIPHVYQPSFLLSLFFACLPPLLPPFYFFSSSLPVLPPPMSTFARSALYVLPVLSRSLGCHPRYICLQDFFPLCVLPLARKHVVTTVSNRHHHHLLLHGMETKWLNRHQEKVSFFFLVFGGVACQMATTTHPPDPPHSSLSFTLWRQEQQRRRQLSLEVLFHRGNLLFFLSSPPLPQRV